MWMTEEETKKKVCPLVSIKTDCRCAASGCMAWRQRDDGKGYCGLAGVPFPIRDEDGELV